MNRRAMLSCVAVLLALFAAACGSNSPSSPSSSQAVNVQGVVLGGSAAAPLTAQSNYPQANGGTGKITVTVAGTTQTTTVSASGTFELNVEAGTFTLVFYSNGVEIGRLEVTAQAGAQVKIVVQVQNTAFSVVQVKVDGEDETETETEGTPGSCLVAGGKENGKIELEGTASSAVDGAGKFTMTVDPDRSTSPIEVTTTGATSFKCNGTKLTAAECKASLKPTSKVHVSGKLVSCTTSPVPVNAAEVMVQKADGTSTED